MTHDVLITGGAGFIGSHLADELLRHGCHVRVLDCLIPQVHGEGCPDCLNDDVELCRGDLRDPATLRRALDGRAPELRHLRLLGVLAPHALARLMARAAIFALPARYEPFGLFVLEAGLAGCALVLGDIPSLREIWQETALFVPPDDPDATGAALAALIKDTAERERLARAGDTGARPAAL